MNRRITGALGVATALGLAATLNPGGARAATGTPAPHRLTSSGTAPARPTRPDDRPDLLARRRSALQQKAVDDLTSGKATTARKGPDRVIRMADDTEVPYPTTQTAQLLTFLVDFGAGEGNPDYPENSAGPVHDHIPRPGPEDNSTYWESSFSRQHYLDMFFNGLADQDGESFHDVYDEMSSGRFDLQGDVSDWVQVPHPESYYQVKEDADGDPSTPETGEETGQTMKEFVGDSGTAWEAAQKSSGMTDAQVRTYLARFDVWDRYDYDHDGNYHEPDGYIDHFQAIHAGEGEDAGSDTWKIWSHRSSVAPYEKVGPTVTDPATEAVTHNRSGGVEIGDTGFYIRDYTTEPENGGLGVFAHEFGHDLGLPDYYDTQGGDNGTGFWNLMSSGSWMGHGTGTIGTTPDQMGATEKLFLGWYGPNDLATVDSTHQAQSVTLGPSYHATTVGAQALKVNLPRGSAKVTLVNQEPGSRRYLYSGTGDDRDARLTSPAVTVPASGSRLLTARVAYSLEDDFDYTYLRISTDHGVTWDNVATNRSVTSDPNGSNQGYGITGCSGTRDDAGVCSTRWVTLTADLSAYAGESVQLQLQTVNDGGYHELGFVVDKIAVGGSLLTDVENGAPGWALRADAQAKTPSWTVVTGSSYTRTYDQYYLAENRTYRGYDSTLATGPYSFDYPLTANDVKVDHFPYDDGLLVWYANGLYDDNNTNHVVGHPGGGQALPVDANPRHVFWTLSDGTPWSYGDGRLETLDSTFDVDRTRAVHLVQESHDGDLHYDVPSRPSVSVFDDSDPDAYWDHRDALTSWYSTRVAGSGTSIRVLSDDKTTGRMTLRIAPVAPRTTRPVIRGAARVGTRLTVAQSWTLHPTLRYQWLADGVPIGRATGAAFTPTVAQLGKALSVRVSATKAAHPSATATSGAVRVQPARVALSVHAPRRVREGRRLVLHVATSTTGLVPAGRIRVRFDHRTVTKALRGGRVTVSLRARHAGRKKVVVTYLPARGFAGTSVWGYVRVR